MADHLKAYALVLQVNFAVEAIVGDMILAGNANAQDALAVSGQVSEACRIFGRRPACSDELFEGLKQVQRELELSFDPNKRSLDEERAIKAARDFVALFKNHQTPTP